VWAAVAAAVAEDAAAAAGARIIPGRAGVADPDVPATRVVGTGWRLGEEEVAARLGAGLDPVGDSCAASRLVWGLRRGAGVRVAAVSTPWLVLDDESLPRAALPGQAEEGFLWGPLPGPGAGGQAGRRAAATSEAEACECDRSGAGEPAAGAAAAGPDRTAAAVGQRLVEAGCSWEPRHAVADTAVDRDRAVCSVGRWGLRDGVWTSPLEGAAEDDEAALLPWDRRDATVGEGLPLPPRPGCPGRAHVGHTLRRLHPVHGLEVLVRPSKALTRGLEAAGEAIPHGGPMAAAFALRVPLEERARPLE